MKKTLLLVLLTFTAFNSFGQTTYVFNGDGNWTDTTQWENGNYPGTTIDVIDTVEILGKLIILESTGVINNGIIESFSTASSTPEIKISGNLVNNGNINFSRAEILVDVHGRLITNALSELVITDNSILTNTGSVEMFGGTINIASSVSSIINDSFFSNNGILNVLSGTFQNKSEGNSSSNIILNNTGTFNNINGTIINRASFNILENGNLINSKTFTNEATGSLSNNWQITITGFSSTLINYGNLNNSKNINLEDSSTLNMTTGSTFTNQGTGIVVVDDTAEVINKADDFSLRPLSKFINNGTINSETTIFISSKGKLENNGTLNNNYGALITNYGIVSGINTVHKGSFSNDGILSPGNTDDATGLYKMDSFFTTYTQTADGSLNIELEGTVEGDNYDQVIVDSDAIIGGTLNVTLLNGFEPAIGDVFTILLQGRNVSGSFATVNLPTLSGVKEWDVVEYSNTDGVRISVKDSTLGILDINKESLEFKIYPNPVSNEIFISGISTMSNAYIIDLNGIKILEAELTKDNSSIDLSAISSGVYLLNIEGKTFKFVKE